MKQSSTYTMVRLEGSNFCQLSCPSCTIKNSANKNYLTWSNFKKLIDINPQIRRIELSNHGEIFLNPDLYNILKYAHQKKISININNGSNLNTVDEKICEALVKYEVKSLVCAIDGTSQETYQQYRIGGDLNTVLNNVKKINTYKQKYKSKFPILHWQYIIFGHNEHQISDAIKIAQQLNMIFKPTLSWDPSFSPIKDKELVKKETGLQLRSIGDDIKDETTSYHRFILCTQLWNYPQIKYNGEITGCCCNDRQNFGNAFNTNLKQSLNNEKINYARNMLMGKKEPREDIPCSDCQFYKISKKNNQWLTTKDILISKLRQQIIEFIFHYVPFIIIKKGLNFLYSKRI